MELIYFGDDQVDLDSGTVNGLVWKDGEWCKVIRPIPRCIINIIPPLKKNRTDIEVELRKISQFTTGLIGNKSVINNRILKRGVFSDFIIPSWKFKDMELFKNYLHLMKKVILKPVNGRQGKNIYYVECDGDSYLVKDHIDIYSMDFNELSSFIDDVVEGKDYIYQPYLDCRTNDGNPFDFRIHTQRDGKGEWIVTKIYPRIGDARGVLSNISRGGVTQDIGEFLHMEWGDDSHTIKEKLKSLALELSEHIDGFYDFNIDELGVDLSIDRDQNIWFYEANTGPQSKYHEAERAKNTIAYAKYIEETLRNDCLQGVGESKRKLVAMFSPTKNKSRLKITCDYLCKSYGVDFMFFTRKGVDKKKKMIKGYYYDGINIKSKLYNYPDVVIDRVRLRNNSGYDWVYKELSNSVFNNNLRCRPYPKNEMNDILLSDDRFKEFIIPTLDCDKSGDELLLNFIESNDSVFLKLKNGNAGRGARCLSKLEGDCFKFRGLDETHILSMDELKNSIRDGLFKGYIAQKEVRSLDNSGRSCDLRVNVLKNIKAEWKIAKCQVRVGKLDSIISNFSDGGFVKELGLYFQQKHLSDNMIRDINEKIEFLAKKLPSYLEEQLEAKISHIALDLGLDQDNKIWIYEVNIHKPLPVMCEQEVGKLLAEYAIYLLNCKDD